jgi:hypothetical protein
MFGPRRDEVTGGWRKLHDEELNNLYWSPSVIRMVMSKGMKCAGHVAEMVRNAYRLLAGTPEKKERKRVLGRPRRRWIDNIGCTTLKAYINLLRGRVQRFELSQCSKTPSFTWDSYGSV